MRRVLWGIVLTSVSLALIGALVVHRQNQAAYLAKVEAASQSTRNIATVRFTRRDGGVLEDVSTQTQLAKDAVRSLRELLVDAENLETHHSLAEALSPLGAITFLDGEGKELYCVQVKGLAVTMHERTYQADWVGLFERSGWNKEVTKDVKNGGQ